jgi:hypothetical protein
MVLLLEDDEIVFTCSKKSFLGIGRKFKFAVTMKYAEDTFEILKTEQLGAKLKEYLAKKLNFLPEFFKMRAIESPDEPQHSKQTPSIEDGYMKNYLKTLGIGSSRSKLVQKRKHLKVAILSKNLKLARFLLKKYTFHTTGSYLKSPLIKEKLSLAVLEFLEIAKTGKIENILKFFKTNLEGNRHEKIPYFDLRSNMGSENTLLAKRGSPGAEMNNFKIENLLQLIYDTKSDFCRELMSKNYKSEVSRQLMAKIGAPKKPKNLE